MKISEIVIAELTEKFNGKLTHHSGHTKTGATLIYDFPKYGGYQLAVRQNKNKLSLYVNAKTRMGRDFEKDLPSGAVQKRYPEDGKPSNSLLSESDAPYLTPKRNKLLLITIPLADLPRLVSAYLDAEIKNEDLMATGSQNQTSNEYRFNKSKRKISLDELEGRLAAQREIGKLGEQAAFRYECARLEALGCANPMTHVRLLSEDDVGAGYDLESEFEGNKRYIEVKSSSVATNDSFYMSENEKSTLTDLGHNAYIYLVRVDKLDPSKSTVIAEIENPLSDAKLILEPVAYKVTVNFS